MFHINATIADNLGRTKSQKNVIMTALQNGGTYNIKDKMRELDAALQLAEKYPDHFTASQPTMFNVIFTIKG